MEEKDVAINYMVVKKEKSKPNVKKMVKKIIDYVQNNEIYFKYGPTFYEGVLIFGIIGFQTDHDNLQKILGKQIQKSKCKLKIIGELK